MPRPLAVAVLVAICLGLCACGGPKQVTAAELAALMKTERIVITDMEGKFLTMRSETTGKRYKISYMDIGPLDALLSPKPAPASAP